ncbi:MAG TPA: hypothetical protein VNI58_01025 [Mariprofundaceae bacterium]|nr:hypothetical protein [Mariprofundaceae bacterium]
MKRLRALLLVLPLLFSLNACLYNSGDETQAEQLVKQWHDAFKAKNWDAAFALYDKSFYNDHPRDAWLTELKSLGDTYGALKDIRPVFHQKNARLRGDYYIYGFHLIFEKGSAAETITVFKALESDKLTIAGHMIQPKGHQG